MPGTTDPDTIPSASFTLKNASGTFEGRSNNVFGSLETLEQTHLTNERNRTDTEEYANLNPIETDDFVVDTRRGGHSTRSGTRDREVQGDDHRDRSRSILNEVRGRDDGRSDSREVLPFRTPVGRAPHTSVRRGGGGCQRIPDHGNIPQGWTHYNLEDVNQSDLSEKTNTQAALAFLDERRKLREQQQDEEKFDAGSGACSKGLFSFAKRSKKTDHYSTNSETKSSQSGSSSNMTSKEHGKETAGNTEAVESDVKDDEDDDAVETEDKSAKNQDEISKVEKTAVSTTKSFKSRKGIKRNIRSRDDNDD